MSEDIVYQVLLQRMDDIQSSIKEVRDAQSASARDARDTAVKLERVLGQLDQLSSVADQQRAMEGTITNIDLRLEMAEAKQREPTECEEKQHEKRIEKMERSYSRFITAAVAALVVVNIMLYIAKEIL